MKKLRLIPLNVVPRAPRKNITPATMARPTGSPGRIAAASERRWMKTISAVSATRSTLKARL